MRAMDIPRVLSPGNWSTKPCVTFDPSELEVFPGYLNPLNKKSSAVVSFGSMQNFPLTNTALWKGNRVNVHISTVGKAKL